MRDELGYGGKRLTYLNESHVLTPHVPYERAKLTRTLIRYLAILSFTDLPFHAWLVEHDKLHPEGPYED
jgi:hypothetical protein